MQAVETLVEEAPLKEVLLTLGLEESELKNFALRETVWNGDLLAAEYPNLSIVFACFFLGSP